MSEWVSDCLMPTQQFFSCIMARTSYFQWDVDEVNQRTDNTMAKRTNNDLQNTAQKTKDLATRIPLNTGGELGCSPEGYVIPALEWVSDCLMPTQQFFSCIMARTSYFQWDVDEVHFVLDQHIKLDFYSASSFY
jgi:hypothetical protein